MQPDPPPSAPALRARFDAVPRYTIGIEDEVMLLDRSTFELAPIGSEVLSMLGDDPRFKLELPASQLEIVTPACASPAEAAGALSRARCELASRVRDVVRLAGAGVHPFSSGLGALNELPRYEHTIREYGPVAERQLACALQVQMSVGHADRALAVYNAARSYLPLLAALAANAPFYEGRDTGLASIRPLIAGLLPRQGIPPAIASWEAYAETLAWGASTGAFTDARTWWWELRLHPGFGTLEFRVPDGQSAVSDAAAIAAVVHALVVWLAERHQAGEALPVAPRWRIEQNRWSACRHGVEGMMVALDTGARSSTRECLLELLETLEPLAERFGSRPALQHARALVHANGAMLQRRVAAAGGVHAVAPWLAERFLGGSAG